MLYQGLLTLTIAFVAVATFVYYAVTEEPQHHNHRYGNNRDQRPPPPQPPRRPVAAPVPPNRTAVRNRRRERTLFAPGRIPNASDARNESTPATDGNSLRTAQLPEEWEEEVVIDSNYYLSSTPEPIRNAISSVNERTTLNSVPPLVTSTPATDENSLRTTHLQELEEEVVIDSNPDLSLPVYLSSTPEPIRIAISSVNESPTFNSVPLLVTSTPATDENSLRTTHLLEELEEEVVIDSNPDLSLPVLLSSTPEPIRIAISSVNERTTSNSVPLLVTSSPASDGNSLRTAQLPEELEEEVVIGSNADLSRPVLLSLTPEPISSVNDPPTLNSVPPLVTSTPATDGNSFRTAQLFEEYEEEVVIDSNQDLSLPVSLSLTSESTRNDPAEEGTIPLKFTIESASGPDGGVFHSDDDAIVVVDDELAHGHSSDESSFDRLSSVFSGSLESLSSISSSVTNVSMYSNVSSSSSRNRGRKRRQRMCHRCDLPLNRAFITYECRHRFHVQCIGASLVIDDGDMCPRCREETTYAGVASVVIEASE